MGQPQSKQKLDQITESLNRIRKDVRNGKITANDVENMQEILQKYSREVEGARNVRASRVYTVGQLLDITSQELDALKQEINLDLAVVPTDSFKRGSSKNNSKKEKRKSVKSITDSVLEVRGQIRNGEFQTQDHDRIQRDLVTYSQQLSSKKNNKGEVEAAQKLISSVSEELFTKQQERVDSGSLRRSTNSSLKRSSLSEKKEQEPKKEMPKIASKNIRSTLDDIEIKLETLKNEIKVAETNRDKSRLHFLFKSIQTLMTDLQMVDTTNLLISGQRKEILERNLQRAYKDIDKIKRQLTEDNDLKYLTELAEKQKREKCLQDLDELQKSFLTVAKNVTVQNFQTEKNNFVLFKDKLSSIEETDQEISLKKAEVADVMLNTENAFTRVEMEERLNQAEWRHFQYKIDLKQFVDTTDSEVYKKHRQYLQQLRDYVNKVSEINQKIDDKKKYVMYNIDNNIIALEQKAKENEEKLKDKLEKVVLQKQESEQLVNDMKEEILKKENEDQASNKKEEVVLRKPTTPKPSNKNSVVDLVTICKNLPTNCTSDELEQILPSLHEAKRIIEQKLSLLLQNQVKINQPNIQLVKVKEKQLSDEPDIQLVKVKERQLLSDEPDVQLVTVKQKEFQSVTNSVPSIKSQIEHIEKEVESLQIQIENSRYTKETQLYKDVKNKLENYKIQVRNICRGEEKAGESVLKYIDNVLLLLENNMPSRRSTTEDLLVDIMSVSTRVNDLGSKIQNFSHTIHDYDSIKNSLLEQKLYLKNLHISPHRVNISKSRDDIVQQIDRYLTNLENVNKIEANSEEEKSFNQDLRKVKEKVFRYSGTYKNVLYKTIENDLDKYLTKADDVFKDRNVVLKVKQDIENTKMILEQRSTKDQQVNVKRDVRQTGNKELIEIRENVETVKRELNVMEPLTKEDLDKLDARLTLSVLALDNIKDDHSRAEKEKLYQDIDQNFKKIQESMVAARPEVPQKPAKKEPDLKQITETTIATIRKEIEEIKPQILTFVGPETSPDFVRLDEVLVRGTLELDRLNIDQTSELFQKKIKLMGEIHKLSDILDERIMQTEEIEKYEKKVKVILIKIDSFNGYFGDNEYKNLDEEIISIQVSLGRLTVAKELQKRKEACMKEVDMCMKRLDEAAKKRSSLLAGTLV